MDAAQIHERLKAKFGEGVSAFEAGADKNKTCVDWRRPQGQSDGKSGMYANAGH